MKRIRNLSSSALLLSCFLNAALLIFSLSIANPAGATGGGCADPPSGLISWWPADGNANDAIGTNHGTLLNGATFAPGIVGQAFSFDGIDDLVQILSPIDIPLGNSPRTFMAWIKSSGPNPGDVYQGILGYGTPVFGTGQSLFFERRMDARMHLMNLVPGTGIGGQANIEFSHWYFAVLTHDGETTKVYVNGVLDGTDEMTYDTTLSPSIGFLIGSVPPFDSWHANFNGLIDEMAVFNRALSATEIFAIYLAKDMCALPQQCISPPSGLVSWWKGDGDANDVLGTNNGVLLNGATFADGVFNQAFSMDGVDDYVQVASPTNLPLGNAPRTIDVWFKTPRDLTASTESSIVQYGAANYYQMFGLITSANAPGKLYFYGHGSDLAGTTTIQPDTWYHGAVTYDGSTLSLYVNGQLEASAPMSLNTVLDGNGLTIGYRPGGSHWEGRIDEVDVFDRALTSQEIAAIYNAGSAGKCKPCLTPPAGMASWWTADGDADDVIGTNHGTLQSGATFAEGMVGQAFSFDGVDDYVSVPSASSLDVTGGDFTIGAWIYPTEVGVNGEGIIGKLTSDNTSGWGFAVQGSNYGAPGKINFFSNGDWAGQSSEAVSANVWTLVAVTRSGNLLTYYINGSPSGSFTRTGNFDNALSLSIGDMYSSNPSTTWKVNGFIDEVEIFSRALSDEEIAAIHAAGSAGMCIPIPIPTYTITTSVPGGNGTIVCTSPVNQGDSSTCTISPDTDYHLATLTDNGTSVIGSVSGGQYVISNVTADHEVIGTFSIDTFPLSIAVQGTGTVTSDPAGVNCGSTCDALFDSGTLVTLTATPATGSFFAGWSGDCNAGGEVTMTSGKSCTATFTAYTALQVQAPNGGEDLMAGQSFTIRWGAPAAMETFNILYSLDGGLTWKKQATRTAGNSHPWTLPVPAGSGNKKKCLVRVIGYNSQGNKVGTDTSDRPFVINVVRLDSPNDSQPLDAGTTVPVTWTRRAGLAATTAKVYYSLNQGLTWVYSGQANADTGQYDWQLPLMKKPMTTCRLKVTLINGATVVGSDKSDGNFTIRTVEVLDPNGGETLPGGQPYEVSYNVYTRYPYARADVYLSLDGGATWKLAGQQPPVAAPSVATLSINVPAVTATKKNCKLKVQLVDDEARRVTHDTSNAVFTISHP